MGSKSKQAMTLVGRQLAIIPSTGLGDGLVMLVLAHNLYRLGAHITVFHGPLSQLASWFPDFHFEPLPEANLFSRLGAFDLTIQVESYLSEMLSSQQYQQLGPRHLFLRMDPGVNAYEQLIHQGRQQQHPDPLLHRLVASQGVVIPHIHRGDNMVSNLMRYCQATLGVMPLKQPRLSISDAAPRSQRVIIHPASSAWKRNWAPAKFIQVARQLAQQGYEPIFAVSPQEFSYWNEILETTGFMLTQWSLDELAQALCEACLFIGNDSGPGHLASILGIPTVTVHARKRSFYMWRPGWSRAAIAACPIAGSSLLKGPRHLRSLLSASRVMQAVQQILNRP